jgi:hypothetical protein
MDIAKFIAGIDSATAEYEGALVLHADRGEFLRQLSAQQDAQELSAQLS